MKLDYSCIGNRESQDLAENDLCDNLEMGTMGNNAEDKKAVQVGCGGKGKPGPWSVSEQQVLPLEGGRVEGKPGSQPPSPGTQAAGGSSLHHFCRWPQYSRSAW